MIKRSYAALGADGLLLAEQTTGLVSEAELDARIGVPNGIAPLDSNGAIPPDVLAPTGTPDGTKFLRDDNSWQSVGAGSHPDLATHDAMGLAVDAHNHTGTYEPVHSHPYSATAHNHDASYAPTHGHPYEASGAVSTHAAALDPHPTYLTSAEGNAAYEASGAVTAHAGAANPHSVYATDTDLTTHAATPHGAPSYLLLANGATAMGFGATEVVKVTPTANATYTTTVPAAGSLRVLLILTSGTTSRTITFGTGFKPVGTLATGTVTARVFAISFVSDGTNLYETGRTAAMVA